jgi:hypothetical protein
VASKKVELIQAKGKIVVTRSPGEKRRKGWRGTGEKVQSHSQVREISSGTRVLV